MIRERPIYTLFSSVWIRISLGLWIRIRNGKLDLDPGRQKSPTTKERGEAVFDIFFFSLKVPCGGVRIYLFVFIIILNRSLFNIKPSNFSKKNVQLYPDPVRDPEHGSGPDLPVGLDPDRIPQYRPGSEPDSTVGPDPDRIQQLAWIRTGFPSRPGSGPDSPEGLDP